MARRIKYTNGDIFCIELEDGFKGYGRIIKSDNSLVFIELYKLKVKEEITELDKLNNSDTLLSIWSIDKAIKKGEWKIVGNIPVDSRYKMPNFWTKSPITGSTLLYEAKDTFDELKDALIINQEQILNAQPYGIYGDIAARQAYIREMKKLDNL